MSAVCRKLSQLLSEDEVDAVVRQLDDFRRDGDVETAAALIDFDDALHVGLHGRLRQSAARLRLHFNLELVVLGLLVAFEGDAVQHRIFNHSDDDTATGIVDANVGKKAGRVERLEAVVDFIGTQTAARARPEIRADGLRFDPAVAFNHD
jgi:hypothetical protein